MNLFKELEAVYGNGMYFEEGRKLYAGKGKHGYLRVMEIIQSMRLLGILSRPVDSKTGEDEM